MPERLYVRFEPDLRRRKASYPDGAWRAFCELLFLGDGQPRRGRFESERILRAQLGKRARWMKFLAQNRDYVVGGSCELPHCPLGHLSTELYIVGWDEWQEGDIKPAPRSVLIARRRGQMRTPPKSGAERTADWRSRRPDPRVVHTPTRDEGVTLGGNPDATSIVGGRPSNGGVDGGIYGGGRPPAASPGSSPLKTRKELARLIASGNLPPRLVAKLEAELEQLPPDPDDVAELEEEPAVMSIDVEVGSRV